MCFVAGDNMGGMAFNGCLEHKRIRGITGKRFDMILPLCDNGVVKITV
jgi:hypothetical protein